MLDTKIVGLLSRLNVVRYLRNNHRVMRKMKRYQIVNRVPHTTSTATGSSTVSRTNQNTGPPTVASFLIKHKRFVCTYHF